VLLEDVLLPLKRRAGGGSVLQSRLLTLGCGVAMTLVACRTQDVIAAITIAYDFLVGSLFVPVVGAMLWRRGTELAAIVSIALSAVVVVGLLLVAGIDSDMPIYIGSATSLVVFVLVSLWGPRDSAPAGVSQEG
jgi:SSS family solute:Na+ symporter